MKMLRIGTILQVIYLICCIIVIVCMPLYTAYYPTSFALLCFKIGALFTFISTFNPMGIIGTIMNIVAYCTSDQKSRKHLVWIIISPVVIILSWLLAVTFFVHHSGGV